MTASRNLQEILKATMPINPLGSPPWQSPDVAFAVRQIPAVGTKTQLTRLSILLLWHRGCFSTTPTPRLR